MDNEILNKILNELMKVRSGDTENVHHENVGDLHRIKVISDDIIMDISVIDLT